MIPLAVLSFAGKFLTPKVLLVLGIIAGVFTYTLVIYQAGRNSSDAKWQLAAAKAERDQAKQERETALEQVARSATTIDKLEQEREAAEQSAVSLQKRIEEASHAVDVTDRPCRLDDASIARMRGENKSRTKRK